MTRLLELQDPQLCLMLLRCCEGMPKLVYCWRTIPPQFLVGLSDIFHEEIRKALRKIIVGDGPQFGEFQSQLSSLPVSLGGLGIYSPSHILSVAYPASFLSCFRIQRKILGLDLVGPQNNTILPDSVLSLVQTFAEKVSSEPDRIGDLSNKILARGTQPFEDIPPPLRNLQQFMARILFETERSHLLSHPYITTKPRQTQNRFRVILDSALEHSASAWLFALPNGGLRQRMTPLEFQAAISYRLLIPQCESITRCNQRLCKSYMDIYGYHALCCSGHLLPRHNIVRDAIYDSMVKGRSWAPEKDAQVTCLGHNRGQAVAFRPADILANGDDFDKDCIDCTVVSPIKATNPVAIQVRQAAEVAEAKKYTKHLAACESAGYGFKAFAIDVFGVMAKESSKLLQRIISKLVREMSYPVYRATALVLRRVSFAVQLGVARNVILCRAVHDG